MSDSLPPNVGNKNHVPLLDVAQLNPRRFSTSPVDHEAISFVPMKAVEAETGKVDTSEIRDWGSVKKGYTTFQDGDVIVAKITPCMENGKFAIAKGLHNGRGAGSTEFHVFRPSERLLPEYLFHFLFNRDVRENAKRSMRGAAGQLRVPPDFYAGLRIPLPDIDEQRAIVAEIEKQCSRLDAGVAALKRLQANLKRYRSAVLKAGSEGKLVPTEAELARQEGREYESGAQLLERILVERRAKWNGRGKYTEPTQPDVSELPELPDGWSWSRVQQLSEVSGGLTKNPARSKLPNKLPYLRVANVYANELRLDKIECIGVDDSELNKLLVQTGDLLVVEGNGSKDQIGRLAMWDGSIEPCVHQNHLIRVRPVPPTLSGWILHWLLSPVGRHFVELVASSTSGLNTLSISKVSDLPVPLPPLDEQVRIVAEVDRRLSVVEEIEAAVEAGLKRAARLKQGVLQKAFSPLSASFTPGA